MLQLGKRCCSAEDDFRQENLMVTRYTKKGNAYREPPYTAEEEAEFYRRMSGGPVTVVKPALAAARPRKPQPQPPEE
jgi:hypothetical protein